MVCDLFCVPVDVTPFLFIYTHIYIKMVISSTTLGYEIGAVEFSKNINNRAIYGLRFLIRLKIVKVAHTPIYNKQLNVHRWLRVVELVPPNCHKELDTNY